MKALGLLGKLHRDGGIVVATHDARERLVAHSVLYPDGDLISTVVFDLTPAERARHVAAIEAELAALRGARAQLAAWLSGVGAAVATVSTGLALESHWVSGAGATGVVGVGYALWRMRRGIRIT